MKSLRDEICLTAGYGDADLISSEAVRRRFHPSLLGFHRAQHDFIIKGIFNEVSLPNLCTYLFADDEWNLNSKRRAIYIIFVHLYLDLKEFLLLYLPYNIIFNIIT